MQQYKDARFTATVSGPQPEDSISGEFDLFRNALRFVRYAQESKNEHTEYGTVRDNRSKRIVLRVSGLAHWSRERVKLLLCEIAARSS